jgi:peptide deformylase
MIPTLVLENDKVLRTVCPNWVFNDSSVDIRSLVDSMRSIMIEFNGIGLAAPQIGFLYRIFIMGDDELKWVCINPEILEKSVEEVIDSEGCLSFPALFLKVKRAEKIKVKYFDIEGEERVEVLTGIWSRCFQHELDHLNGIVFTEKVSKLSLDIAKRKRKKNK